MRKFFCTIISLTVIFCILFSTYAAANNATYGTNCSTGGIITKDCQSFILEHFGDAPSPEALAGRLLFFALQHFTYDESYTTFPQTCDTGRFIFQNDFHGVCMDFAAFVNSVFQVVCRHKGWDHAGCHVVVGMDLSAHMGHAVNYLSVTQNDGSVMVYEFDTTWDLSRFQSGISLHGLKHYLVAGSREAVPDTIRSLFSTNYSEYSLFFVT